MEIFEEKTGRINFGVHTEIQKIGCLPIRVQQHSNCNKRLMNASVSDPNKAIDIRSGQLDKRFTHGEEQPYVKSG